MATEALHTSRIRAFRHSGNDRKAPRLASCGSSAQLPHAVASPVIGVIALFQFVGKARMRRAVDVGERSEELGLRSVRASLLLRLDQGFKPALIDDMSPVEALVVGLDLVAALRRGIARTASFHLGRRHAPPGSAAATTCMPRASIDWRCWGRCPTADLRNSPGNEISRSSRARVCC